MCLFVLSRWWLTAVLQMNFSRAKITLSCQLPIPSVTKISLIQKLVLNLKLLEVTNSVVFFSAFNFFKVTLRFSSATGQAWLSRLLMKSLFKKNWCDWSSVQLVTLLILKVLTLCTLYACTHEWRLFRGLLILLRLDRKLIEVSVESPVTLIEAWINF